MSDFSIKFSWVTLEDKWNDLSISYFEDATIGPYLPCWKRNGPCYVDALFFLKKNPDLFSLNWFRISFSLSCISKMFLSNITIFLLFKTFSDKKYEENSILISIYRMSGWFVFIDDPFQLTSNQCAMNKYWNWITYLNALPKWKIKPLNFFKYGP